jgi:hypothetical protein
MAVFSLFTLTVGSGSLGSGAAQAGVVEVDSINAAATVQFQLDGI